MTKTLVMSAIIISVILVAGTVGFVISSPDVFAAAEKVTICHKPGTPAEQTLEVAQAAEQAHLNHGDFIGSCEAPPPPGDEGNIITCICELGEGQFCDATSCLEAPQFCTDFCTSNRLGPLFVSGCSANACILP